MKTKYKICLLSIGGSPIPYGNIVNDSRKYGNYNLEYLASFLENNSIVSNLLYFNYFDDDTTIERTLLNYDVVIFFADYLNNQKIKNICKQIKKINPVIKVIGFGKFVDKNCVNYCSNAFDFLCLGNPMQSVLNMLQNDFDQILISNDKNVFSQNNVLGKFPSRFYDASLTPKIDYYKLRNIDIKYKTYVVSTRNDVCFGQCTFCLSNKGEYLYRDAKSVVSEIKKAVSVGVRDFLINDNDFFEIWSDDKNKKRIWDIINGLSEIREKITISCFAKSKTILQVDEGCLQKFKDCGLYCIFIGIDAGNLIDKEIYQKGSTLSEDRMALRKMDKLGIFKRIGFICVNPFSTPESLRENYQFLTDIKSSNIYHYGKLNVILFKGAALYQKAFNANLVRDDRLAIAEYGLANQEAAKMVRFLNDFFCKLDSNNKYYPFISFKRTYEEARFLSPISTEKYKAETQKIEGEEFKNISDFFKVVFVENDLKKAERLSDSFLENIYSRSERFKVIANYLDEIIEREKYHGISN